MFRRRHTQKACGLVFATIALLEVCVGLMQADGVAGSLKPSSRLMQAAAQWDALFIRGQHAAVGSQSWDAQRAVMRFPARLNVAWMHIVRSLVAAAGVGVTRAWAAVAGGSSPEGHRRGLLCRSSDTAGLQACTCATAQRVHCLCGRGGWSGGCSGSLGHAALGPRDVLRAAWGLLMSALLP